MRPRYLLTCLALACLPTSVQGQFGSGEQVDTTGWAPAGVGVRGGYDNELQGWMTGAYLSVPVIRRGSIELLPNADITFLPGFKEYQGNLELVYIGGGRRGGLMAGGGVGLRNSVFGPDPTAERRTVTTFSLMIGARIGTGRIRGQVETRWILQDEYAGDPRHVAIGVGFALW
jgi:hypothetical protein